MNDMTLILLFIYCLIFIAIIKFYMIFKKKVLLYTLWSSLLSTIYVLLFILNGSCLYVKINCQQFNMLIVLSDFFLVLSICSVIKNKIFNKLYLLTLLPIFFLPFLLNFIQLLIFRTIFCLILYFIIAVAILLDPNHNNNKIISYALFISIVVYLFHIINLILYKIKHFSTIDIFNLNIPSILIAFSFIYICYVEFHINSENEKLKLEKIIELNQLKDDYMINISHELRTPINIIINTLLLIELNLDSQDSLKENKISNYTKTLKKNVFRLIKLNSNLKSINEIAQCELKCNVTNCEITKFINEIVMSTNSYADSKKISIEFNCTIDETILLLDSEKIERVMLNLLSNAIKFTRENGTISVKLYECDNYVFISVTDTGIGISEKNKELIFTRFKQIDNIMVRKSEGCGIGLYISKAFVELHNGVLEIVSEPNKGSTFTFSLPKFNSNLIKTNEDYSDNTCYEIEFSDL